MLYTVKLSVVADDIYTHDEQRELYIRSVFSDLNKILMTKGAKVTSDAEGKDEHIYITGKYSVEAENEQEAAKYAYDFCLTWKNTHGAAPDVDVSESVQKVSSTTTQTDKSVDAEVDALKKLLTARGVKFHHKAGVEKLSELELNSRNV